MASKLIKPFGALLRRYKQLPYVAEKRYNKYYLIPHRPTKLQPQQFTKASNRILKKTQKYNQYFASQKLRIKQGLLEKGLPDVEHINDLPIDTKVQASIETASPNEKTTTIKDEKDGKTLKQNSNSSRQYDYKYKEPLRLMAINVYHIFLREEARKLRLQQQKKLSQQQSTITNDQKQKDDALISSKWQNAKHGIQKSVQNIQSFNKCNLSEKWKNFSEQQKQVYTDIEMKIKQENEKRIQQFIENHEIPMKKKYSAISRFTTRYAPIHQLQLKDKKLYDIYRGLSNSEKEGFTNEAKRMNQQSRQKYLNFLKKWKLSEEMLKQIIEISINYKMARKQQLKETRKKSRQKQELKLFDLKDLQEDSEDSDHDSSEDGD